MIFSSVFGKFARFKNLVTRGASYESNTGELAYNASIIKEIFGFTAQDSGRKIAGVAELGFPGLIYTVDVTMLAAAETSIAQMQCGIAKDTGVPGPPDILYSYIFSADPVSGNAAWQIGTVIFADQDGANGSETVTLSPNGLDGRLIITGIPIYADEAAAVIGGEAAGVVYQTATGELRIKL